MLLALLLAAFSLDDVGAEQAIVVVTASWADKAGTLQRYERARGKWLAVGEPVDVVVGEAGLGWGLGAHPLGVGEPRKTEGDRRAPAGVFRLVTAFGPGAPVVETKMPWLAVTPSMVCVDDPASRAYNRIVDAKDAPPYQSAEKMKRDDALYELGVVVDHNALGTTDIDAIAGRGSCIFLHIWRRKGRGTEGCTAMARPDLEKLVSWLDPAKKPVLVQLPRAELIKHRTTWGLP